METLEYIVVNFPLWFELLCQGLGALTIFATVVARLTPTKKDDKWIGFIVEKIWNLLDWLPTIGVDPKVKQYKESLKSVKQS